MRLEDQEVAFENKQMEIVLRKGIVLPGEVVKAVVSIWKYSMSIFFLGLLARILQKRYLLVVTTRRVLLIHVPAFLVHGSEGSYFSYVEHDRPCALKLVDDAKKVHQNGNPVVLPSSFASFVGRPKAFVVRGIAAQDAFSVAEKDAE